FKVAHFANEDDVRVLTKCSAQRGRKVCRVHFDLALIDEAALVAVQELDRVFNRDQVIGARRVDAVDHRRERSRLTGTGGTRDANEAALIFANLVEDNRKIQFFDGANLRGNDAKDHADVAALLEHVDAEAAKTGDAVRHVKLGGLLKLLLLAVGH